MIRLIAKIWLVVGKVIKRLKMFCFRQLFKSAGRNLIFTPSDIFTFHTISLGEDVFIGPGAHFSSLKGLEIGDRVMFGPNVTILGGNHNSELSGKAMRFNAAKRESDDEAIFIEEDSWIGAGATILKGVTIGRGAIVGAASVVTRNVEPYAIITGCPAKLLKFRGTMEEIKTHESRLYAEVDRLPDARLSHLSDKADQ